MTTEIWVIVDDRGNVVVPRTFSSEESARRCCLAGEQPAKYVIEVSNVGTAEGPQEGVK